MQLDELIMETAVPGLSLYAPRFEQLIGGLQAALSEQAADQAPALIGVPPVIPRSILERSGYVEAFPHLLGTVYAYEGDERQWRSLVGEMQAGRDWGGEHRMADVAVLPAICCHLYPQLEGAHLDSDCLFDVTGYCYRHERSHEPGRMRAFRMREFVRVGNPAEVRDWRLAWLDQAREWLTSLGLQVAVEAASDPFFGGGARLMGPLQEEEQLKWELVASVDAEERQAVASANYHKDHFGSAFEIEAAGGPAHSACMAFGLERIAMAVLEAHGADPANWPLPIEVGRGVSA